MKKFILIKHDEQAPYNFTTKEFKTLEEAKQAMNDEFPVDIEEFSREHPDACVYDRDNLSCCLIGGFTAWGDVDYYNPENWDEDTKAAFGVEDDDEDEYEPDYGDNAPVDFAITCQIIEVDVD